MSSVVSVCRSKWFWYSVAAALGFYIAFRLPTGSEHPLTNLLAHVLAAMAGALQAVIGLRAQDADEMEVERMTK